MLMKKLARGLCSALLKLNLLGVALIASLVGVIASPEPLKHSLADNQLYANLTQNVLKAAEENTSLEGNAAPADKQRGLDALKVAASAAFTPEVLQAASEEGLDGMYRWLNGQVAVPDYRIDLSAAKSTFLETAGAEVERYAADLPVCTPEQARQLSPDADPFALTCRPANLTPAAIRQQAVDRVAGEDFLPNPVLTTDNLAKDEQGQNFFERTEEAPRAYRLARALPWLLLLISLLLGAAVLLLSETKRQGFKRLGISLLGAGVFLLLTTWLIGFLFDRATQPSGPLGKAASEDFRESILALARSINELFNRTLLRYCLAYIILGAIILLILHFTKSKELERLPTETEAPATPSPAPSAEIK